MSFVQRCLYILIDSSELHIEFSGASYLTRGSKIQELRFELSTLCCPTLAFGKRGSYQTSQRMRPGNEVPVQEGQIPQSCSTMAQEIYFSEHKSGTSPWTSLRKLKLMRQWSSEGTSNFQITSSGPEFLGVDTSLAHNSGPFLWVKKAKGC